MVETRIASRHLVSKAGTIEFVGGGPINWIVGNLSITGAIGIVSPVEKCDESITLNEYSELARRFPTMPRAASSNGFSPCRLTSFAFDSAS
jgi:hypothetical protein